ncbi:hypothetical protein ES703_122740 [subsurface metagenome]
MKIKNETCDKCGMEFEVPEFDEERPVSEYFPKWDRAVLKHGWQHHHSDFPPQFRSFTRFMKWLTTPEGKQWNRREIRFSTVLSLYIAEEWKMNLRYAEDIT